MDGINRRLDDAAQDAADRLGRGEERSEQHAKQIDKLEDWLRDYLEDMEDRIKGTINGRIATVEARNSVVRTIVYSACAMILVAFLGAVVAWVIDKPGRVMPTMPQPYTIPPIGGPK